ncbi:MAG: lipoate--protein ligase [Melioribacteraceae bacterium]|nr:lipoate--protein ligase [Melioribacteraceae bacterium]
MKLVNIGENRDPRLNLAIEEYVIRNFPTGEDYVLFYINNPSVIIGKNQNVFEEVNLNYANLNKIEVVRRISGGGAVYHDHGNLNYSLISKSGEYTLDSLSGFNKEVVGCLNKLGVPAVQNKRNDIYLDGKKISGNARFSSKDILCTHSTLLFDADINHLRNSLDVSKVNSDSKSTKSVRSGVNTIKEYLKKDFTIDMLKDELTNSIFNKNISLVELSESDYNGILKIQNKKYNLWEWNFGRSPKSKIKREVKFRDEVILFEIEIKEGIITNIDASGSTQFSDIKNLMEEIKGAKYIIDKLRNTIDNYKIENEVKVLLKSIF